MIRTEILSAIWRRSRGHNVFMPRFRRDTWYEGDAFTVKQALLMVESLPSSVDQYFTPLLYDGPRRRAMVGDIGVIFADLDGGHVTDPGLGASVVIESSPGHYHGYWFLKEPVPAVEWEPHARGWSQLLMADPGGWDVTQVLRMPETLNHKYTPPATVRVAQKNLRAEYDLHEFPQATIINPYAAERPLGSDEASAYILKRSLELGTVPLSAVYWLVSDKEEISALGTIDRSRVMWQLERSLFEAGFTSDEVFHMIRGAGVNKWAGQDEKLWAEVQKAAAS